MDSNDMYEDGLTSHELLRQAFSLEDPLTDLKDSEEETPGQFMDSSDIFENGLTLHDLLRLAFSLEDPLTDLEDSEEETPPEPTKKESKSKSTPEKVALRGLLRQDQRSVTIAKDNQGARIMICSFKLGTDAYSPLLVVFDTFDLRQAVDAAYGDAPPPTHLEPKSVTEWLDDTPRLAIDGNNIPLVLHIPNWQREKGLVGDVAT